VIRAADEVLLERRPPQGIWGGLWSLPQCDGDAAIEEVCRERFGVCVRGVRQLSSFEHGFTHFTLEITPWVVEVEPAAVMVFEGDVGWWKVNDTGRAGVPAPVRKLLDGLLGGADAHVA
jgi:A/G-specific adenine glycosylase